MVHFPFRMTQHGLSFEFELDDGYRLVHLRHQLGGAGQTRVIFEIFGLPDRARVIAVNGHREVRERQQVDAITLFEGFDVGVADTHAQHGSQ